MGTVCFVLFTALGSGLRSQAALQIENAALRHQLAVLQRLYCPRVLGQWFDGIRFYAAASSPTRSRRTWAGLR